MAKPQANILTCLALAGLTLGVFGVEQSAGPESTVRRYLASLSHNDPAAMQSLLTTPVNSDANVWLIQAFQPIAANKFKVTAKQRDGNYALVKTDHDATVLTPSGQQPVVVSFFWVLNRDRGVWRIDPVGTYRYRQQSVRGRL